MTTDNLKNSWRPATASPADPTGKPAQSAAERMDDIHEALLGNNASKRRWMALSTPWPREAASLILWVTPNPGHKHKCSLCTLRGRVMSRGLGKMQRFWLQVARAGDNRKFVDL
jgi:hypothetical protein